MTSTDSLSLATLNASMLVPAEYVTANPGPAIQDAYFYAMAAAGDAEALASVSVSTYRESRAALMGALSKLGWAHVRGPKSKRDAWRVVTEIRTYALHVHGIDAWLGTPSRRAA